MRMAVAADHPYILATTGQEIPAEVHRCVLTPLRNEILFFLYLKETKVAAVRSATVLLILVACDANRCTALE